VPFFLLRPRRAARQVIRPRLPALATAILAAPLLMPASRKI
jgi:hypothetical protein